MKKVIGITGSIGSGKSYAVKNFKEICEKKHIEAIFIDVDEVRRNILKKENIDRKELNNKIYSNELEMKKYKEYINPKIREYLKAQINMYSGFVFIEWALLLEDEFYDLVDSIIMIDCTQDIQIERLQKSSLNKEEIIRRMNLQMSNKEKIEKIIRLKKELFTLEASYNPQIEEYENLLKKVGLYE